jgi:hypothetical protein
MSAFNAGFTIVKFLVVQRCHSCNLAMSSYCLSSTSRSSCAATLSQMFTLLVVSTSEQALLVVHAPKKAGIVRARYAVTLVRCRSRRCAMRSAQVLHRTLPTSTLSIIEVAVKVVPCCLEYLATMAKERSSVVRRRSFQTLPQHRIAKENVVAGGKLTRDP